MSAVCGGVIDPFNRTIDDFRSLRLTYDNAGLNDSPTNINMDINLLCRPTGNIDVVINIY